MEDPCQDIVLVVQNGQRWACVACWETTCFYTVEASQPKNVLKLPACDFLQPGRNSSEVLLCKANEVRCASPAASSSLKILVRFSDAVWQVLVSFPYIVGCLRNASVEVALDSGQVVQTVTGVAVPRSRFSACSDGQSFVHFLIG
jgi:hypothetical protein